MENLFYATIALYMSGKTINKENIMSLLEVSGRDINMVALEAMIAFYETLKTSRQEEKKPIDSRLIEYLEFELSRRKVQTTHLEALIEKLTSQTPSVENVNGTQPAISSEAIGLNVPVRGDKTADEFSEGIAAASENGGRYIYGVAPIRIGGEMVKLGNVGIEGSEVYTVPYKDLCAIVHDCSAELYKSGDNEVVKEWVKTHQKVVEEVKERFGTVIPVGFDTIIRSTQASISPEQMVQDWLMEDYDRLCVVMKKIIGKNEYGVQISYKPSVISKRIHELSEEIKRIREEMANQSPGMAYMYRQKLEKVVRSEMERLADEWFKDFYERIRRHAGDIVVEKTKKLEKDKVMLLNLSCLLAAEGAESLGKELEKINDIEGFSVHFSGPWPPYSFVAKPAITVLDEQEVSGVTNQISGGRKE